MTRPHLTTALRFSHGVSLLYGHEKEGIENSTLPSASRVFWLAVFMITISILLYLMAANIIELRAYLLFTTIMLLVDLGYILVSGVVRGIFWRPMRVWAETCPGYPARAALQWIGSDVLLIIISLSVWFASRDHTYATTINPEVLSWPAYQLLLLTVFAGILIILSVVDYWWNHDFYFGGRNDRRTKKFVFVCSPLSGDLRNNILRAQWYCKSLVEERSWFGKEIVPFASHAFFTYFLDDEVSVDRILGRKCALAFLAACDAVYVYVPTIPNQGLRRLFQKEKLNRNDISDGMRHELDEVKKLGLEIRYRKREAPPEGREWKPIWSPLQYDNTSGDTFLEDQAYFDTPIKRVYVCTPFRGKLFNGKTPNCEVLRENIRIALWCCHELVRSKKDPVAPFAPQAFYPYFWSFLTPTGHIDKGKWDAWFERSIEVLKSCDAVYVYTTEGLPDQSMSEGMKTVVERALSLGIEVQYRKIPSISNGWSPALPDFGFFGTIPNRPEQSAA